MRVALAAIALPTVINLLFARNPPLGIILHGAVLGSLYGLVASGLILIYRANKIISFAQAGLGAAPAVAALMYYEARDYPYTWVVLILVGLSLALGALVDILVIRRFANAPRLILTVATIGVAQILIFLEIFAPKWVGGSLELTVLDFTTPFTRHRREIGGVIFSGDHLVTVITVTALIAWLAYFLKSTRPGIAIRATAENGQRAQLVGMPVKWLSTLVWAIAALLSGVGVFLRAPLVGLPLGGLAGTSLLLYTLTCAVIGRMTSIPIAFGAGIAVGVIDQSVFYATRNAILSQAITLPLVLVALLIQRKTISRAEETGVSTWQSVREFRPIPRHLLQLREVAIGRAVFIALAVALALGAPYLVGEFRRIQLSLIVLYAIVGISLVILTGWAGQISLGQWAFVGMGAAVAGSLATEMNTDFFVAVLAAGLVGAGLAVVVGLPALRVQGLYLAVTTLAFAAMTYSYFFEPRYFGWLLPDGFATRPSFYGRIDTSTDLRYYYVCLAGLLIAVGVARAVRGTRSGRVFIAARDNIRASQAYGINTARTRLVAFATSGFLCGMAGALYAYLLGSVDRNVFSPRTSIELFAMTIIGGLTSVPGAIVGAVYVGGLQYLQPDYALLATGAGMLLLLLFFPGGFSEIGFRGRDAFVRWAARRNDVEIADFGDLRFSAGADDEDAIAETIADAWEHGGLDWVICPRCDQHVPLAELPQHGCLGSDAKAPARAPAEVQ